MSIQLLWLLDHTSRYVVKPNWGALPVFAASCISFQESGVVLSMELCLKVGIGALVVVGINSCFFPSIIWKGLGPTTMHAFGDNAGKAAQGL